MGNRNTQHVWSGQNSGSSTTYFARHPLHCKPLRPEQLDHNCKSIITWITQVIVWTILWHYFFNKAWIYILGEKKLTYQLKWKRYPSSACLCWMHAQSSTPVYFPFCENDKRKGQTHLNKNHNIYIAKDSRSVIKRRGPGISPGYYECGPQLLSEDR